MKNNRKQKLATSRRRGAAPIELVLCLPFLVGALAVIFTLASAGLTKSQSAVTARHNAWRERNNEWQDSPTYSQTNSNVAGTGALGVILALGPGYATNAGLLEGNDSRSVAVAHPGYESQNLTTDANHFVLGGAWDHRRVPSTDRGRLVPSNLFTSLDLGDISMPDMSGFADLLSADLIANVGSLLDGSDVVDALTQGKADAVKKIAELNEKIEDLKEQIEELKDADPPDWGQIQALQQQIQELYNQISEIQDAMGELDNFGNQLPI
ncbi:Prefoldin subunit [Symmachiella dynata]|uniref:Prefoldin subunit n=1 Tax=Symmachiella dynata TaxID=2527995 RepID=A0A517ZQV8_9PLAN|nr:FlxA-like family protein [Symmachiella dynata]QDU44874.1 Prefoldin subunit [Symmachiella dynata]